MSEIIHGHAGAQLVVPYDMYAAALCLDGPTLANLELLQGSNGEAEGSLLAALDTCASPGNFSTFPPKLYAINQSINQSINVRSRCVSYDHLTNRLK